MSKPVIRRNKEVSIFNFDNYKSFVELNHKKIKAEVDDHIKCLQELENQVMNLIRDDKICVFNETPSQKRKRLFTYKDLISSSPLKEDVTKMNFKSVISAKPGKINHFNENSKVVDISEFKIARNTPTLKMSSKRRNSNNYSHSPPQKITNKQITISKNLNSNEQSLKNTSSVVALKTIEDKKEQRRMRAEAVEKRRKALEEERRLKLLKKQQTENSIKFEKSQVFTPQVTPKPKIKPYTKPPIPNKKISIKMPTLKPITTKPSTTILGVKDVGLVESNEPNNGIEKKHPPKPEVHDQTFQLNTNIESTATNSGTAKRNTFDFKTPTHFPQPLNNYKITPEYTVKKPFAPPIDDDYTSYDINNLQSDDNTDDEEDPSKPIPKWAQDKTLWLSIVSQNKDVPINGEQVFGPIPSVMDYNFFARPNLRYYRRTSSAQWETSMIEPI